MSSLKSSKILFGGIASSACKLKHLLVLLVLGTNEPENSHLFISKEESGSGKKVNVEE